MLEWMNYLAKDMIYVMGVERNLIDGYIITLPLFNTVSNLLIKYVVCESNARTILIYFIPFLVKYETLPLI